jgi:hypothetical protein
MRMRKLTFDAFSSLLLGNWAGHRRGAGVGRESVRSEWCSALEGGFLHERWYTAGDGESPKLTAEAFFRLSEAGPTDFVALYMDGRIAFGESTFDGSAWTLTHRWLREPGVAQVRLRFLDDETYEQEVLEIAPDGTAKHESIAVQRREHAVK